MCGRATLTVTEVEIEKRFDSTFYTDDLERYNPLPSFNIAPTHNHPVYLGGENGLRIMKWGLVPFWAKDPSIGSKMINARIETVGDKPAFKKAFDQRRCLVPFDGYFEWKKEGRSRIPFRIALKDRSVFAVAGIYERWSSADGIELLSFSVITQPAADHLAHIHDRMPAILQRDQELDWLSEDVPPRELLDIIHPLTEEFLEAYPVSDQVNKVANNHPDLIEPIDEGPQQLKLF